MEGLFLQWQTSQFILILCLYKKCQNSRSTSVSENNSKKFVLPAGKYSYPFQFQLPPNLPSSYEGEFGYVRYYVKAVITKPWRLDYVTKTAFSVLSALDLNAVPEANVRF